ncbi:hypothetical protein SNN70_004129 [Cronobacter malonaticus]|nr:hypothetical protein [Cronobacter malonaticus]
MKKHLTIMCFIIIFISTFFMISFKSKEISCTGNITFIKGREKLSLIVGNKMDDGKGLITLSGTLDNGNNEPLMLSKKVNFNYSQNKDVITAKSVTIHDSPENEVTAEEITPWLPDFFIKPGTNITWVINRRGLNAWLFFSNPVPLYLCEK